MDQAHELGVTGEKAACDYLEKKGYTILERNWRHQKDEVDLIALEGDCLVIIEVKTRSSLYYGEPQVFVTRKKQAFMIRAANAYIFQNDIHFETRFDIISVIHSSKGVSINHIRDAFYPTL
jgi:putative endonuclease